MKLDLICPKCSQAIELDIEREMQCPGCQESSSVSAPESVPRSLADEAAEWQELCEQTVFAINELIYLAGRQRAGTAVIELVRWLPRSPEEWKRPATRSNMFMRY